MYLARFLMSAILLSAVVQKAAGDELEEEHPVLAGLTLPKDELPPGCKVQELPANGELKGLKNRAITDEARFFTIGDERLKDLIDSKVVKACYFGLYREKNDLGIIGWAFASEDDAQRTRKALATSYAKEPERFRLWQEGKYVIWLWRDPGTTDSCFKHFDQFVKSRINLAQGPDEKARVVRAAKATQIAKAWVESLLSGQAAVTIALSDVPFAWDRKETIELLVDLEKRLDGVAAEKRPRDLRVTKVEVRRDERVVPKDSVPADVIIVIVRLGDDAIEVAVQPGDAYRVVGFSD